MDKFVDNCDFIMVDHTFSRRTTSFLVYENVEQQPSEVLLGVGYLNRKCKYKIIENFRILELVLSKLYILCNDM